MTKADLFLFIFFTSCTFFLGWAANELWEDYAFEKELNGLYIHSSTNESTALDTAKVRDSKGDWVCINVAYEMSPEVAYTTCVHECTHKAFSEIYAEECEHHPSEYFKEIWDTNTETLNSSTG